MENILDNLNERQVEAVKTTKGPLLVLAGAGSGKTKVLTSRIAYLVQNGVKPREILAVTFTNKAAKEMKARLSSILGEEIVKYMWVGTFHSICGRILRQDIENYIFPSGRKLDKNFTIYDDSDCMTVVKNAIKKLNLDDKIYQPKYVSARDYVNDLASKLRGKKEKVSSFMTVAQFANELRNSQYSEEELAAKERIELQELYRMLKEEPFGLRDGFIPVVLAYELRDYQNVSLYFHGNEHSYTEEELVKALSEPENYTLFICNWNEEEMAYIEGLERIFADYLPKGDRLNRLEELFKAINTHYSSISKSARTTEAYVSDIAKKYRNILSLSYKDYNAFFFEVLPSLNSNLQELVLQIENIKKELESVKEKLYVRVVRVIRQVFGIDESEDMIQFMQLLYKNDWEGKSQKAFDYTTNNVLDVVSRSMELSEEQFVLELAKVTTGFELTYWADNKVNDFEEILRDAVSKLNEYNPREGLQHGEMKVTIEAADGVPVITTFSADKLSPTGKTMLNKMKSTLGDFGESISYEEKISILTEIMKEVIG